jgi:hypothetical protein
MKVDKVGGSGADQFAKPEGEEKVGFASHGKGKNGQIPSEGFSLHLASLGCHQDVLEATFLQAFYQ